MIEGNFNVATLFQSNKKDEAACCDSGMCALCGLLCSTQQDPLCSWGWDVEGMEAQVQQGIRLHGRRGLPIWRLAQESQRGVYYAIIPYWELTKLLKLNSLSESYQSFWKWTKLLKVADIYQCWSADLLYILILGQLFYSILHVLRTNGCHDALNCEIIVKVLKKVTKIRWEWIDRIH